MGIKKNSSKMLITLVNGGAIVDFRSKTDGSTAMHRAVTKNSIEGKVMGVKSLTLILLPFCQLIFFQKFPNSFGGEN